MRYSLLIGLFILRIASLAACSLQINQDLSPTQTVPQSDNGENIPVTWASLNLTDRLIYTVANFSGGNNKGGLSISVNSLELTTGKVKTIFATAIGGWINSLAVSPDHQKLILSYEPPSDPPVANREAL